MYWYLQNKGLVNTKKDSCHSEPECKVTKSTTLGYVDKTTNMNDINHLHLGVRPLHFDSISVKGFAKGLDLRGFENPLDYLPHNKYALWDDTKTRLSEEGWEEI